MLVRIGFYAVLLLSVSTVFSQSDETKGRTGTDSTYIKTFVRNNDVRIFYGGQGNRLVLGSSRDESPDPSNNFNNTNDFIGVGLSYKWIDGDLSFSVRNTTYLNEERSTLDQFRVSAAHTGQKIAFRGYLCDSKGMVVSGNSDEYESQPALHEFRMGLQVTYVFNEQKYSYRAALYQNDVQLKTAGSFLLRAEPFYRSLGKTGSPIVPSAYDTEERFGEQTGMSYIKAPGLLLMPGYGINIVFKQSKWFISPVVLVGAGTAVNTWESDSGKGTKANMEYNAYFLVNAGYTGTSFYSRIQINYTSSYSPIQPAYLTSTNLMMSVLVGFRFRNIEGFL